MKKIILIVIIVIVVIVILVGRWQLDVGSDCTIEPNIETSQVIYAQTPGVLTSFNYRSGDLVEQGNIIGQLTNIELQDDLEQVKASIKESEAQQIVLDRQVKELQQKLVSTGLKKR